MFNRPVTKQTENATPKRPSRVPWQATRATKPSEVFRILEQPTPKPMASVPTGLWKSGWLAKAQGAA